MDYNIKMSKLKFDVINMEVSSKDSGAIYVDEWTEDFLDFSLNLKSNTGCYDDIVILTRHNVYEGEFIYFCKELHYKGSLIMYKFFKLRSNGELLD